MNLMDRPIKELSKLIKHKKVSPVELINLCLSNIENSDKNINSYIRVEQKRAIKKAKEAEKEIIKGHYRGVLHGIPYSAKDNINTKGIPTTMGSKVFEQNVPTSDATVIERLNEAGAILIGKNNMSEFALGATNENEYYGPTRNPSNLNLTTGGSSGGSAASVSASSSSFSIGTDTGGSILTPSALCGTVGMRPTLGRVSRYGVFPLSPSFDTVGPITKDVWDSAAVLSVISGKDIKDEHTLNHSPSSYTSNLIEDNYPFRNIIVGFCEDYFFENITLEIKNSIMKVLHLLENLGANVVKIKIPHIEEIVSLRELIRKAESYSIHSSILEKNYEKYGENIRYELEKGQFIPASSYINSQSLLKKHRSNWRDLFENIDLLVHPTTAFSAFSLELKTLTLNNNIINPRDANILNKTAPSNFIGNPSISIPCGITENKLPIGLQIQGGYSKEHLLFQTAYALQARL